MSKLTRKQFLTDVREALNHLRNPTYLRQSPLAALFGVANQPDAPVALRQILVEAVKSLKPEAEEPSQSPIWRLYESLFYRYVQYFNQVEVADQLGISTRQLRREQHRALEELASRLWKQFDLEAKSQKDKGSAATAPVSGATTASFISEDMAWLKDVPPAVPTDLGQELPAALNLARSLADQHQVHLEIAMSDNLPHLAAHPVAVRQVILCLLTVAIRQTSPGGQVHILTQGRPREVEIHIRCDQCAAAVDSPDDKTTLTQAQELTDLFGGRLVMPDNKKAFSVTLILPSLGQLPVLAIDDNADTLNLLQRYTAGTRYHLVGTQDSHLALELAEKLSPQIIVLDVMMPNVDGWELLGRLRHHPLTAGIPIIVCTILTQEELALSLGASAFVLKPISRQAFLAALDGQVSPLATESR